MAALILPDLVEEKKFWPVLVSALGCLGAELDAAGGPPRCYTGFTLGTAAGPLGLMDCKHGDSCGGVAWVRAGQVFPYSEFPNPTDGPAICSLPNAMIIEMGVARCAPRAQGKQMYPDPQSTFNALRLYMSDQAAMQRALCCVKDAHKGLMFSKGSWDPLDQGAGTAGGTWTFTVG